MANGPDIFQMLLVSTVLFVISLIYGTLVSVVALCVRIHK